VVNFTSWLLYTQERNIVLIKKEAEWTKELVRAFRR
jgi:hypothetical protein